MQQYILKIIDDVQVILLLSCFVGHPVNFMLFGRNFETLLVQFLPG